MENVGVAFSEMSISPLMLQSLQEKFDHPTPVQQQMIPVGMSERDFICYAHTGSGKSLGYCILVIERILVSANEDDSIRALIVTPTRELAVGIHHLIMSLAEYEEIKAIAIYGGVSTQPQIQALSESPDILVATPGRLLQLIEGGYIQLDNLDILVFDDLDRQIDMGFKSQIELLLSLCPVNRQTILLSASMGHGITEFIAKSTKNTQIINSL